jgi:hypothetical protein
MIVDQCSFGLNDRYEDGVLGVSPGITPGDLSLISLYALIPFKHEYYPGIITVFPLENNRVAVMQAFEGKDHVDRSCPFHHVLVFTRQQFCDIGANPFALMRAGVLQKPEAGRAGISDGLTINVQQIKHHASSVFTATESFSKEVLQCLFCGLLNQAIRTYAFLDAESWLKRERLLEFALLSIPVQLRVDLHFSTGIFNPQEKKQGLWSGGLYLVPAGLSSFGVDSTEAYFEVALGGVRKATRLQSGPEAAVLSDVLERGWDGVSFARFAESYGVENLAACVCKFEAMHEIFNCQRLSEFLRHYDDIAQLHDHDFIQTNKKQLGIKLGALLESCDAQQCSSKTLQIFIRLVSESDYLQLLQSLAFSGTQTKFWLALNEACDVYPLHGDKNSVACWIAENINAIINNLFRGERFQVQALCKIFANYSSIFQLSFDTLLKLTEYQGFDDLWISQNLTAFRENSDIQYEPDPDLVQFWNRLEKCYPETLKRDHEHFIQHYIPSVCQNFVADCGTGETQAELDFSELCSFAAGYRKLNIYSALSRWLAGFLCSDDFSKLELPAKAFFEVVGQHGSLQVVLSGVLDEVTGFEKSPRMFSLLYEYAGRVTPPNIKSVFESFLRQNTAPFTTIITTLLHESSDRTSVLALWFAWCHNRRAYDDFKKSLLLCDDAEMLAEGIQKLISVRGVDAEVINALVQKYRVSAEGQYRPGQPLLKFWNSLDNLYPECFQSDYRDFLEKYVPKICLELYSGSEVQHKPAAERFKELINFEHTSDTSLVVRRVVEFLWKDVLAGDLTKFDASTGMFFKIIGDTGYFDSFFAIFCEKIAKKDKTPAALKVLFNYAGDHCKNLWFELFSHMSSHNFTKVVCDCISVSEKSGFLLTAWYRWCESYNDDKSFCFVLEHSKDDGAVLSTFGELTAKENSQFIRHVKSTVRASNSLPLINILDKHTQKPDVAVGLDDKPFPVPYSAIEASGALNVRHTKESGGGHRRVAPDVSTRPKQTIIETGCRTSSIAQDAPMHADSERQESHDRKDSRHCQGRPHEQRSWWKKIFWPFRMRPVTDHSDVNSGRAKHGSLTGVVSPAAEKRDRRRYTKAVTRKGSTPRKTAEKFVLRTLIAVVLCVLSLLVYRRLQSLGKVEANNIQKVTDANEIKSPDGRHNQQDAASVHGLTVQSVLDKTNALLQERGGISTNINGSAGNQTDADAEMLSVSATNSEEKTMDKKEKEQPPDAFQRELEPFVGVAHSARLKKEWYITTVAELLFREARTNDFLVAALQMEKKQSDSILAEIKNCIGEEQYEKCMKTTPGGKLGAIFTPENPEEGK